MTDQTGDIEVPVGVNRWTIDIHLDGRLNSYIVTPTEGGRDDILGEFLSAEIRDYCLQAAREYPAVMKRVGELESLVRDFAECEVEYMRINNLGDGEKQHNVKRARALLGSRT